MIPSSSKETRRCSLFVGAFDSSSADGGNNFGETENVSIHFYHGKYISMLLLMCAALLFGSADAHGYQVEPKARNVVAKLYGTEDRTMADIPLVEYCPHCLNRNYGVCGRSEGGVDYDIWTDARGADHLMPWASQEVYLQGDNITIASEIRVHHGGHLEVKACPLGRNSTQDCMEEYVLTFLRDVTHDMPADPNHPDRGYLFGGASWTGDQSFVMEFKLPDHLVGDRVLIQWRYITANSCSPPGYSAYFASNSHLPENFWQRGLSVCPIPYSRTGELMQGGPEQFFNCAEVTVLPNPNMSVEPTGAPIPVPSPGSSPSPTTNAGVSIPVSTDGSIPVSPDEFTNSDENPPSQQINPIQSGQNESGVGRGSLNLVLAPFIFIFHTMVL